VFTFVDGFISLNHSIYLYMFITVRELFALYQLHQSKKKTESRGNS